MTLGVFAAAVAVAGGAAAADVDVVAAGAGERFLMVPMGLSLVPERS